MRVLVRCAGGSNRSIVPLLVLLLHGVILSQFSSVTTTVAASRLHVREVELHRSLARYRQLLQHDDSGHDVAKDPEINPEQEKEINLAKSVDEFQGAQNVEQEHHGDDDPVKAEDQQKQEENEEKESEREQHERDEKAEHATLNSETQDEGEKEPIAEEEIEEHQKLAEVQKTDQESESNPESHQQGDERQETELKTEEQHTEDTKDVESKIEENKSEEGKTSESENEEDKKQDSEEQSDSKNEEEKPAEEEPYVFPSEPYLLGPTIKDWDEQRGSWLDANPHMKTKPDGKPRVLVVSGSQPNPCRSPIGDNFHIKSLKLKIDYARMHNYEFYYSFAWLDPLFNSYWVKLPIVRKLMLTHPEIEWFFWLDSDALFTDMIFEAPFHTYEGKNMVMWGYHEGFYVQKSWVAFNAGVFMIRNCQWSLDLIDKWSPMGPDGAVRNEYGRMLSSFLSNRPKNYEADDQSALAYLMLTDEAVNSKIKLVDLNDYMISAWWVEVVDNYETSMEKYHPGLGDPRWPWITHFTGCGPCGGDGVSPDYLKCMKNIERAINFADNQVLAFMGFQHESLSSDSVLRIRNESGQPLEFVGFNPWQERIAELAAATA